MATLLDLGVAYVRDAVAATAGYVLLGGDSGAAEAVGQTDIQGTTLFTSGPATVTSVGDDTVDAQATVTLTQAGTIRELVLQGSDGRSISRHVLATPIEVIVDDQATISGRMIVGPGT